MATHGAGGGGGGGGSPHKKFFKILLPGTFELRLSIPPKFAAGLGEGCLRRAAAKLLRDGRSWDVDLHRDSDGDGDRMFLTGGGWRGFVSANGISAGQLLVLEHRGCLDFAVDVFDASGCLSVGNGLFREEAAAIDNNAGETPRGDKKDCRRRPDEAIKRRRMSSPTPSSTATTTTGSGDDDELCRRIERPYQLRLLDVSKSFCERVGWTSSRDVELTCAGGRWPVSVKVSAKNGMMCAGWKEFAQDNGLGLSDACVFAPPLLDDEAASNVNGGVLHVRVIRQGTTAE